ncbi:RNA polymerase sigma factor [Paenibacillus sp. J31TS4]|uniref:RNA polymerase sigma factor n=1 Tax=Paenibacillus sp. J31TS4 TaxID=2807195 RepID=UPI001B209453|nr:RNA polymerase sigma factor [Paenibacillus sp. J31TS4]GIP41261.1 RNA polymerase sigma factor [Paenibacillus sp. J31TS4]
MPKHLILILTNDFPSLPEALQQEVYREYYRLVYPVVFFIIKDHAAVEDIIQDSFLRAITKASQVADMEKLEGWLKTIARNSALNYVKKWKRNRDELDFDAVFVYTEASHSGTVPLEQEVEAKLLKEAVVQYVDRLKPEYRQLLEMRWIHQLSYREMAEAMSMTEGMVRQKLYRAREAVKQKLQEDWGIR